MEFHYKTLANKVIFGEGAIKELENELVNFHHILLLGEKRFDAYAQKLIDYFGENRISYLNEIAQHVPKSLVDVTYPIMEKKGVEVIVALGGGSTIGLAKALVLRKQVPIIAVPTTYAGSEMTNIYGISEKDEKLVGRDDRVYPSLVIYDPQLTASLPAKLATTSAVNALAHLIEALYANNINPVTYQIALKGTKEILTGLNALSHDQQLTKKTNEHLLLGAYLAGKSLNEVNMALHHKAAHTLGGSFGMEHSKVHSVLLVYILQFQWAGMSSELQHDLQELFDHQVPAEKLKTLLESMSCAGNLEAIGFQEADIAKAAAMIAAKNFANPVAYNQEKITELLRKAFKGQL